MPTSDLTEVDDILLDAVASATSMDTYPSGSAEAVSPVGIDQISSNEGSDKSVKLANGLKLSRIAAECVREGEGAGDGQKVEDKKGAGLPPLRHRSCRFIISVSRRVLNALRNIVCQSFIWAMSGFLHIPAYALHVLAYSLTIFGNQGGIFGRKSADVRVFLYRDALKLVPSNACFLNNLAVALGDRFYLTNQEADFKEAISLYRASLKHRPSYPLSLNNLANALRWKPGSLPADLDESIVLLKQAHTLQPSKHLYLLNLAGALKDRFDADSQETDINEAITLYRRAMKLNSSDFLTIHGLASALHARSWLSLVDGDLDEATALYRHCLKLQHSSHSLMNDLGCSLLAQYQRLGQKAHLHEAIDLFRNALRIQPSEPSITKNLGSALELQSQRDKGTHSDEAFALAQEAAKLRSTDFNFVMAFLNLCNDRSRMRFPESVQQLDERISVLRRLHNPQWPSRHPERLRYMNELGLALKYRYAQDGLKTDINEAIFIFKEAAELCPGKLSSVFLFNLAHSLFLRHGKGSDGLQDLEVAISLYRQLLRSDHLSETDKADAVNSLAAALLKRYKTYSCDESDLTESISFYRQALTLRPFLDPRRSTCLKNLAAALKSLYDLDHRDKDLDEVIFLSRQALELQDAKDPGRPSTLITFAESLIVAVERMGRGTEYLDEAMSAFSEAMNCTSVSPSSRLNLAKRWIDVLGWASQGKLHTKGDEPPNIYSEAKIRAYDIALEILPQVASIGLDVYARHRALSKLRFESDVPGASWAIRRCKNPGEVIEVLEAGRNIFWAQALSLRAPLHQLQERAPRLADKLKALSLELERGSYGHVPADYLSSDIYDAAAQSSHLQVEWSATVAEVQSIPGFENFMKQPSFSALQSAASEYPVVFLFERSFTEYCGCLIMTSTTVHEVSTLTSSRVRMLAQLLQAAVSGNPIPRTREADDTEEEDAKTHGEPRGMRPKHAGFRSPEDSLKYILRTLWEEVVKPVIQCLDMKKSTDLPVLKWCPSGIFSQLPLHAAGCYDDDTVMECASDYFISSYTPNLSTLLMPDAPVSSADFKMMTIIQSAGLSATEKELEIIKRHVPPGALMELGVPGAPATIQEVASRLSDASVVHFACHGTQNKDQPLDGGLMLEDGLLSISRIMREKVPNGSLAFLCACKTAMGDTELPDEAITLGASLLFAGFRSVIATMWEMRDEDGPVIADAFYGELFRGHNGDRSLRPDTTKSARALHIAVQRLRSKNVALRRWVPFIHMGK